MTELFLNYERGFFAGDGGYDWMGHMEAKGYKLMGGWGQDGWDLGDWPYLMYARNKDFTQVIEYCEGDTTTWNFASRDNAIAFLDRIAELQWRNRGPLVDDMKQYPLGELPEKYRGPYASNRVGAG